FPCPHSAVPPWPGAIERPVRAAAPAPFAAAREIAPRSLCGSGPRSESKSDSRIPKLETTPPRACLKIRVHCRSRRKEAQIPTGFSIDQSLLTSAPAILKHAPSQKQEVKKMGGELFSSF